MGAAIARTLGLFVGPGARPWTGSRGFSPTARLLLVLDNFEHVLDAAPDPRLLRAAPGVTAVVTSRAPLRSPASKWHPWDRSRTRGRTLPP